MMRKKKIKMKFFKEFIHSLDTSGSTERTFVSYTVYREREREREVH